MQKKVLRNLFKALDDSRTRQNVGIDQVSPSTDLVNTATKLPRNGMSEVCKFSARKNRQIINRQSNEIIGKACERPAGNHHSALFHWNTLEKGWHSHLSSKMTNSCFCDKETSCLATSSVKSSRMSMWVLRVQMNGPTESANWSERMTN